MSQTENDTAQNAPALTHDRSAPVADGVAQALSPLVRRLVAPNPGPFTFTGTCTYIVGQDRVAVIDPGPESEAHLDALRMALAGRTVTAILVTHTHRDHSPGARALKALTGAPIIGCAAHVPIDHAPSGRLDASHDLDHAPDHVLEDGEIWRGDGFSFETVATPGHASNHLCFALREESSLFCGDHVMAWSTTIVAPPDGHMSDYMASLDKLGKRGETIFYPGHGAPIGEPRRYVRALAHHRRQREISILRQIEAGALAIPALVDRIYVGLDARLKGAAALSTLAHMEDLVARGLARSSEGAATMTAQYERA